MDALWVNKKPEMAHVSPADGQLRETVHRPANAQLLNRHGPQGMPGSCRQSDAGLIIRADCSYLVISTY